MKCSHISRDVPLIARDPLRLWPGLGSSLACICLARIGKFGRKTCSKDDTEKRVFTISARRKRRRKLPFRQQETQGPGSYDGCRDRAARGRESVANWDLMMEFSYLVQSCHLFWFPDLRTEASENVDVAYYLNACCACWQLCFLTICDRDIITIHKSIDKNGGSRARCCKIGDFGNDDRMKRCMFGYAVLFPFYYSPPTTPRPPVTCQ